MEDIIFNAREAATRLSKALIWQALHDVKIKEAEKIKQKMLNNEELTKEEKSSGAYFFISKQPMLTDAAWNMHNCIRKAICDKQGFIDKDKFEKFEERLTKMKKYVTGTITKEAQ